MKLDSEQFDLNALAYMFGFFTPHQQRCTLSAVSRRFKRAVYEKSLPTYVTAKIPEALLNAEVFTQFPLNFIRLSHSLENALIPVVDLIHEPWELAAFGGNLPALKHLLRDTVLTKRNESGAGVLHLLAMGGHIELIDSLTQHDRTLLSSVDLVKRNLLFYSSYCAHIGCIAWLQKNMNPPLDNLDELGFHYLDGFKGTTLSRYTSLKIAFLLSNQFDQVESIASLSAHDQDIIIGATINYIESKDRPLAALAKIQELITSSSKIESNLIL